MTEEKAPLPDLWAVVANYDGDSYVRPGAKCWLLGGAVGGHRDERHEIAVRSRGGRWIRRFVDMRRLYGWRAGFAPPYLRNPDSRFQIRDGMAFAGKAKAAERAKDFADYWGPQRAAYLAKVRVGLAGSP